MRGGGRRTCSSDCRSHLARSACCWGETLISKPYTSAVFSLPGAAIFLVIVGCRMRRWTGQMIRAQQPPARATPAGRPCSREQWNYLCKTYLNSYRCLGLQVGAGELRARVKVSNGMRLECAWRLICEVDWIKPASTFDICHQPALRGAFSLRRSGAASAPWPRGKRTNAYGLLSVEEGKLQLIARGYA